jgi:hypothetical protein
MSNEKKEIYEWWNKPSKDIVNPDGKELVNGGMGEAVGDLNKILKDIHKRR